MQNIYFTSDWHLFHSNIIKYSERPFSNVQDMNNSILKMFFSTVNKGDVVYFLGDFSFASKSKHVEILAILKQLTELVDFHFIIGNHDKHMVSYYKKYCTSVSTLKEIRILDKTITLCHYPMHSFIHSHHNSWQLYGHHHSNTNTEIKGKRFNVSVDANHFQMISFSQLESLMEQRDNNWDYLDPEMVDLERQLGILKAKDEKLMQKILHLEKKMDPSFLEKATKSMINNEKIRLEILKSQLQEGKDKMLELKQQLNQWNFTRN
ncbi:metallophosphoesterase family protein [Candidatus Lokiarchaeum ossiferum]|uniref:metallophosphoesterase family protein n=1 Tax=Candidatus Lokiarchaeum ossiferum TaxID=2951803 RepID=UPI00352DF16D